MSVTDRCNFKCGYCYSENDRKPREEILTLEELAYIAQAAYELGFKSVKVTGGEPLVRKNICWLINRISKIPFKDFSLTTNGYYLNEMAGELKSSGLRRVTVSIDSLNKETYRRLTGCKELKKVLKGIDKAIEVFGEVKLNTVILDGINNKEIDDFMNLVKDKPVHLRFIELIPANSYRPVPINTIKRLAERKLVLDGQVENGSGPAEAYKAKNAQGTVGFISLREQAFCKNCNRLRVKANGYLKPCLYNEEQLNIMKPMREGTEEEVIKTLIKAIHVKPAKYGKLETQMLTTGG